MGSATPLRLLAWAQCDALDRFTRWEGALPKAPAGTLYRGREGMWSWVAHRITGVLIFFFLFAHVLDTALVRVDPNAYDVVIASYKNPLVNIMELGLVAAILFHALNGLRVIAVDFWSKGTQYQRYLLWTVVGVWLLIMLGAAYPITQHTIELIFGKG